MSSFIVEDIAYVERKRTAGIEFDKLKLGNGGRIRGIMPVFETEDGRLIEVDLTPEPNMEWYQPSYNWYSSSHDGQGLSANEIEQKLIELNAVKYRGEGVVERVENNDGEDEYRFRKRKTL